MPSLKSIRKRIASVKNTRKITRAMKLVAAARLRRAQEAITAARPYSQALEQVIFDLAARTGKDAHPLLGKRPLKHSEVVVMTSDRGLAGAFNSSILRRTEIFLADELGSDARLRVIGRKGNDYLKRRSYDIASFTGAPNNTSALDWSRELANQLVHDFLTEKTDAVHLIYNEFKSAVSQKPVIHQILPIEPPQNAPSAGDMLFEPSKEALLEHLLPLYVQIQLYRAALESVASELGARMSAMDNATRNAGDMISRLTLQYNRARQAAITKELLEIISGAEALKG